MSGSWVETQVPCMIYCGPDLCNCSAYWYYEELENELEEGDYDYEEYESSLTQDKKERAQNLAYLRYLARLRGTSLTGCQAAGVARLKGTFTSSAKETDSASKSNTTRTRR